MKPALDRRQFLVVGAALGGGMAFGIGPALAQADGKSHSGPWASGSPVGAQFSAWIEIAPDDVVTVHVPEPEIGNGAMTQVAMTVTEELECDWAKVRTVFASIQRNFMEKGVYAIGFQPFFGGHSTEKERFGHALQLGASARERLRAAAAARWGVPAQEIAARNSVLTHVPSGRELRFGEVAAKAAEITLPAEPKIKEPRACFELTDSRGIPKAAAI